MSLLIYLFVIVFISVHAEDVSYQACVDKYSRKGYQPWQEWSDHYTCHRYRCEIRDGKYFIAAVGCRKPKIPENALECHEYIEDENVGVFPEFPTCCARLRCVVEVNGDRVVQTRGQPGELFPDKPWKGQPNDPNAPVVAIPGLQQTTNVEPQPQSAAGVYNNRGAGKLMDGSDMNSRRYVDPYPNQQNIQDSPRKKRSTSLPIMGSNYYHQIFQTSNGQSAKIQGYAPEKYTSYFNDAKTKKFYFS